MKRCDSFALGNSLPRGKAAVTFWCLEEGTYPLGGAFWAESREMGFIDKIWNPSCSPLLAARTDYSRLSALERAHTRLSSLSSPSHSAHCEACADLAEEKHQLIQPQCSPVSTWLSAHTACRHPEPTWLLHSWERQVTLQKEGQRWFTEMLSTACGHCYTDATGCPQPAGWPWHCQVNSVHGCTELISQQKLGVIAG